MFGTWRLCNRMSRHGNWQLVRWRILRVNEDKMTFGNFREPQGGQSYVFGGQGHGEDVCVVCAPFNFKRLAVWLSHDAMCSILFIWKNCLNTFSCEKIRGKSKLAYYQPETLHHLMFHSTLYSFTFQVFTLFDGNALISNEIGFSQKLTHAEFNRKSIAWITSDGYFTK